jgi:hypothetical protein
MDKLLTESIEIKAQPSEVFKHVDNINNTGTHMSKSNMPMMGGSLKTEILSKNEIGPGATYRMYGKVMGMDIDFTETVTKWIENQERVWETIGDPKLLIMGGYAMNFNVRPSNWGTRLTFGIKYSYPKSAFWKFIAFLLGDWYAKWCLKNMAKDVKRALEKKPLN